MVAIDVIGSLPIGPAGHQYILTIIDLYSRDVELMTLWQADAQHILSVLPDAWIKGWDLPATILTDAGPSFKSQAWKSLSSSIGIQHRRAPAYMHRANGISEQYTQTSRMILRRLLQDCGGTWHRWVESSSHAYCCFPHDVLKTSPHAALFGCDLRFPGQPIVSPGLSSVGPSSGSTTLDHKVYSICNEDRRAQINARFANRQQSTITRLDLKFVLLNLGLGIMFMFLTMRKLSRTTAS